MDERSTPAISLSELHKFYDGKAAADWKDGVTLAELGGVLCGTQFCEFSVSMRDAA